MIAALGAGLFFVAEPAAAKAILPVLGGTPVAWGATLLFFQLALILGYGSVDWALRTGGARRVGLVQVGALALASLALLPAPPFATPAQIGDPTLGTALATLIRNLGLPAVALGFTTPAIQTWLIRGRAPERARETYVLYAASNAGSLAGLLAFPWIIEPVIGLGALWAGWRILLWGLALAVAVAWLAGGRLAEPVPIGERGSNPRDRGPGPRTRAGWIARAAIPAALLIGVTDYLTRDLAPVPLLWVVPLALYLVTWIVAFSPWGRPLVSWAVKSQDLAAVVALVLFLAQAGALIGPFLGLAALVVIGLAQHGILARSAPPPEHLGRFYLQLAVGGALGTGMVVAVGPTLFPVPLETPLVLIAAIALGHPGSSGWTSRGRRRFAVFGALATLSPLVAGLTREAVLGNLAVAAGVIAVIWRWQPRRSAAGLTVLLAAGAVLLLTDPDRLGGSHGILGRFAVRADGEGHVLVSGNTLHGYERRVGQRPEAGLYYSRAGAYGDLIRLFETRPGWRIGIVGLGVGSLGCALPSGTGVTWYEINPGVVRLARDTSLFRSLAVCTPDAEVVVGDARLTMALTRDRFDLITIDAFNSDAIPTHLLTREAFALFRERLHEGGIVAWHVSNRFLDLTPVIGALAGEMGWTAVEAMAGPVEGPEATRTRATAISLVAVAAAAEPLEPLLREGRWQPVTRRTQAAWTDDWTPLASVLHLSRKALLGR